MGSSESLSHSWGGAGKHSADTEREPSSWPFGHLSIPSLQLTMASGPTVLMRLVASAYSIAQKAGMIVRRVISEGDLGIVEKVGSSARGPGPLLGGGAWWSHRSLDCSGSDARELTKGGARASFSEEMIIGPLV